MNALATRTPPSYHSSLSLHHTYLLYISFPHSFVLLCLILILFFPHKLIFLRPSSRWNLLSNCPWDVVFAYYSIIFHWCWSRSAAREWHSLILHRGDTNQVPSWSHRCQNRTGSQKYDLVSIALNVFPKETWGKPCVTHFGIPAACY